MAVVSLKYKSKQGTLTAPGDVDPGAMIPIATVTVGSGGASSVDFTSIPQVYEHLQIRGIGRGATNTANYPGLLMRFNSDSGSNYAFHVLEGSGSSASATAGTSTANPHIMWEFPNDGNLASMYAGFVIDILDYSNTNKYKTSRCLSGNDANGSGYVDLQSTLWQSTSAITSINFTITGSNNFKQYSSFALYGIKRAGA
jgi:hypothetical protein